ncbi:MAG: flagellar filament capping protein FliD [Candidatus Nanopelagicales bacterium]
MANAMDGIGTINVGQLVTQLMSVEGGQQNQLKAQQTKQQGILTAYQQLNANMKNLQTSAESIIGSVLAPRSWSPLTATSSVTSVAATASSTALSGTYAFDVTSVAAAHKVLYGGTLALTATAAADPLTVTVGANAPVTIDLKGDYTLQGVITAINSTLGLGVKAAAIQTGSGAYRLQLNATSTGAAGQFTVAGLDPAVGSSTVTQTGTDASIKFGPAVGDVVTSSSNTFSTVFPGMSFTVSKLETGVTVNVASDASTMTKQVQALVDAMNTSLSTMRSLSAYTPGSGASKSASGPLTGDPLTPRLIDTVTSAIFDVTPGTTLATVGIQLDRNGKVTFDAAKFQSALTSDPDGTASAMTGLATRLATAGNNATRSGTGMITSAIQGRQSELTTLAKGISAWDDRLAARQALLTKQYSALNTQLTTMNDQAGWLTQQLSKLSSSGSNSGS